MLAHFTQQRLPGRRWLSSGSTSAATLSAPASQVAPRSLVVLAVAGGWRAARRCAAAARQRRSKSLCSAVHEVFVVGTGAACYNTLMKWRWRTSEEKRAIGLLRKCDVLADIPVEALQTLLPEHQGRQLPPAAGHLSAGRSRAGGPLPDAAGRIKISKVTRDGKELTLAYRTEGDFFGEPCLLDGGPREEMAEAMDASIDRRGRARAARRAAADERRRRLQVRARADRAPQGSRDARRAADLQGRRRQAGRAAAEPRATSTASPTSAAWSSASRSRTRRWRT